MRFTAAGEKEQYGYYHYCLYISDDSGGLGIGRVIDNFTDYIHFINPPFAKMKKTDTCDNSLLLRASLMLKENPGIWYKWVELEERKPHNEGLEKWIFTDL